MRRAALFSFFAIFAIILPVDADSDIAVNPESELRGALAVISRTKIVDQTAWDKLSAQIDEYQQGSGAPDAVLAIRKQQLLLARRSTDPARYRSLLDQLLGNPLPAVADLAREQQDILKRQEDLKTKPVDLKFTAADGTAVDLAAIRGKVVVVDFWASWCVECAFTAKKLAEVYRDLHDKGFEVVGVSLDEDRAKMEAFAKKYGMTWPQSFEGKKWDNPVSRAYGINALPVFWLIDKKGMLVADKEPKNLSAEVKRLLAEP
jgi:thiol-disulfide isomerase/thioredoxin